MSNSGKSGDSGKGTHRPKKQKPPENPPDGPRQRAAAPNLHPTVPKEQGSAPAPKTSAPDPREGAAEPKPPAPSKQGHSARKDMADAAAKTGAATDSATEREAVEEAAVEETTIEEAAAVDAIVELANTREGCWKVLASGKRVQLSDAEWREELADLLAHGPPPG